MRFSNRRRFGTSQRGSRLSNVFLFASWNLVRLQDWCWSIFLLCASDNDILQRMYSCDFSPFFLAKIILKWKKHDVIISGFIGYFVHGFKNGVPATGNYRFRKISNLTSHHWKLNYAVSTNIRSGRMLPANSNKIVQSLQRLSFAASVREIYLYNSFVFEVSVVFLGGRSLLTLFPFSVLFTPPGCGGHHIKTWWLLYFLFLFWCFFKLFLIRWTASFNRPNDKYPPQLLIDICIPKTNS